MKLIRFARVLLLAAMGVPVAASAGMSITINPERLDGEDFTFWDDAEGINNQLEFDVDGQQIGFSGQVFESVGPDLVTITYETGYPNQTAADKQDASASQDTQVLVTVGVNFANPEVLDYFGQAAPLDCSASAKIHDNNAADPDSPDVSQASLSCNLGRDFDELDPPPGNAVLTVLEQGFGDRKDVKLDPSKGKLSIKQKGQAAPPES